MANILIEKHTQRPILMDFGLVKIMRGDDLPQGSVKGTPLYMAPEQIMGKELNHRADIYSAGVMLFEMLVSKLPLPEFDSMFSLITLKLQRKSGLFLKMPSQMNPHLHPDIDKIVTKAVAFDPGQRYGTCKDFLKDLEKYRKKHVR